MFTRRAILAAALRRAQPVTLFRCGDNNVHTYRIPALIETRKGTLIAVADARLDSAKDLPGRIALVIRRSRDKGRTWSPLETLRAVTEGGVGDPSLLCDSGTGRLWCFHAYGPPGVGFLQGGLQVHSIHSDNDGLTWSQPDDLTPQIAQSTWKGLFVTSGTHFQTSRGRFLLPLVVRHEDNKISAHNAYSDDHGATWKSGPSIGDGTDESKAIELASGAVLQNLRTSQHLRALAISNDGGITFPNVSLTAALPDPGCNAGLARLPNGHLIFTNAASESKRENLTARISPDNGATWNHPLVIHPGPAAYSAVVPFKDGSVGVLYECGDKSPYERIAFFRFRPKP